jgi:hypothetical protein
MPTIPLYDTSAPPDGYHHVTAPGGYERWFIRASELHLNVEFCEGDPSDRAYQSAYEQFMARPTRVPPPVPRDYLLVSAGFTKKGDLDPLFKTAPKGVFQRSERPPTIVIGKSSIVWRTERSLIITLAGLATSDGRQSLEGEFAMDLIEPPVTEEKHVQQGGLVTGSLRETASGAVHQLGGWIIYEHSFDTRPAFGWRRR